MAEVTIKDYLNNLNKVKEQLPDVVNDALLLNEEKIVDMNKAQLYDGKTIEDINITPLYSQDSFFKTQAQAQGYIRWKQKITPNGNRNPDAPNLFINGFHYSMIGLLKKGKDIVIGIKSSNALGSSIEAKYDKIYGLNTQHQEKVNKEIVYPSIFELINKYL
jgi:hypothetical protein